MGILTEQAFEGYRVYTDMTVSRGRYRIGTRWFDAVIHRRERLADGRVALYFSITPQISGDVVVAQVQLIDTNNEVWADKDENIAIHGMQGGVLYRFTFDFREV